MRIQRTYALQVWDPVKRAYHTTTTARTLHGIWWLLDKPYYRTGRRRVVLTTREVLITKRGSK